MAENLLSDARVRSATFERDGAYLPDGGGLRIRLLPPSRNHAKGARLAEYHFKLKRPDGAYLSSALHLGTIGDPVTVGEDTRPFTLADARRARDAARELVSRGVDPREAGKLAKLEHAEAQRQRLIELETRRTVRTAFDQWLELYLSAHRKDGGLFVEDLFDRHVLPRIGDQPLATLQRAQVTDLLDALTAAGKRRTANMALSLLRQFVRWCAVRDWIAHDPTLALSKKNAGGKERPRDRALSSTEIVQLRDQLPAAGLPERIVCALWLILATGVRVSEISRARADHFDLKAKRWRIPDTKNGSPHEVALSPFAVRHVKRLLKLRGEADQLLPGRDGAIGDKAIAKLLGDRQRSKPLKGRSTASGTLLLSGGKWTPHDLRRTMATRMREELKISSDVVERCLNHTPQGLAATYQVGPLMAEREAAFNAWGKELDRLLGTKTAGTSRRREVADLASTNVRALRPRSKAAA